jgi:sulfonate transport system permease protein
VLPVAAVALWWLLSSLDIVNSALLVSPAKVFDTAVDQVVSGRLWRALSASLAREATGFLIGTASGLVLGALLGLSPLFNRIVGPSFNTFKQISLFAWIPLISVWFGLGDVAKVVFLSLAALVPVVVNTCDGIRTAPPACWRWRASTATRAGRPSRRWCCRRAAVDLHGRVPGAHLFLARDHRRRIPAGGRPGIGNTLIEGSEHFQMDLVIFGMVVIGTGRLADERLGPRAGAPPARWTGRAAESTSVNP